MQKIFLIVLAILVSFSQLMVYRRVSFSSSGAPIVYWVTDPNPARLEQIALFRAWLAKRGESDIEVRVDSENQGGNKTMVQGVSGIAGDMIDNGGASIRRYQGMGLLEDLTPIFKAAGEPAVGTFPTLTDDLMIDGKVYGTPCNVYVQLFIVNKDAFAKLGMSAPPSRWTFEEFERIGKEFITKANASRNRREVFFANKIDAVTLARSVGLPIYNETMTRPWADTNAMAGIYRRIHQWTYDEHLVPSESEKSSLSVEQGYGESDYQLLHRGYFGMIYTGRHALIQLRKMQPPLALTAIEAPHGGFPNVFIGARSLTMYAGGHYKDVAAKFFLFLRSVDYSMHIVRDADGMPPNLSVLNIPEMLTPANHPNEWELQKAFVELTRASAIANEVSPFVERANLRMKAFSAYMSGIGTPESAAADVYAGTLEEINQFVSRTAERRQAYEAALDRQRKIDKLKSANEKIPASWISNPFLRAYYRSKGMVKEGASKS